MPDASARPARWRRRCRYPAAARRRPGDPRLGSHDPDQLQPRPTTAYVPPAVGSCAIAEVSHLNFLVARVYSSTVTLTADRAAAHGLRSRLPGLLSLGDGLMPGGDHRDAAGGPAARYRRDVLGARFRHRAAGQPLRGDGRRARGAVDRRHLPFRPQAPAAGDPAGLRREQCRSSPPRRCSPSSPRAVPSAG